MIPNHFAKFLEFGKNSKETPEHQDSLPLVKERKGEDEQNIKQKHLARVNSAASSPYEPSYQHSTAASSTDTRHNKTRSEVTSSSIKDWWSRPTYEDIPREDLNSRKELPKENRAETSIRNESQKYVQQRDAAGQTPTPFYGDPDSNLTDNDRENPKPEWNSSQWKETKSSTWQQDGWNKTYHQEEQYEYKKNANWYTTS